MRLFFLFLGYNYLYKELASKPLVEVDKKHLQRMKVIVLNHNETSIELNTMDRDILSPFFIGNSQIMLFK